MAATIIIRRITGPSGSPVYTDVTGVTTRVVAADNPAPGSASPVIIPLSGLSYSYWCVVRLWVSVPPSTLLDNVRFYTDSSNTFGTGIACHGYTASNYEAALGTPDVSGVELNNTNYLTLDNTTAADVFSWTSGSPLAISGSTAIVGWLGSYFAYQYVISSVAAAGPSTTETFSFLVDET